MVSPYLLWILSQLLTLCSDVERGNAKSAQALTLEENRPGDDGETASRGSEESQTTSRRNSDSEGELGSGDEALESPTEGKYSILK